MSRFTFHLSLFLKYAKRDAQQLASDILQTLTLQVQRWLPKTYDLGFLVTLLREYFTRNR